MNKHTSCCKVESIQTNTYFIYTCTNKWVCCNLNNFHGNARIYNKQQKLTKLMLEKCKFNNAVVNVIEVKAQPVIKYKSYKNHPFVFTYCSLGIIHKSKDS